MRLPATIVAVVTIGFAAPHAVGQDKRPKEVIPARFDVIPDIEIYPQDEPKKALATVIRAIEKERYDYVVAHLMDPRGIDRRIADRETFAELTAAMKSKVRENPDLIRGLKLLLREGEAQEGADTYTLTHKDLPDRRATLVKIGQRWFLMNERVDKK